MASSFSEPSPRYGHQSVIVQQKVYLFGGDTENYVKDLKSEIKIFNQCTESWQTRRTGGIEIPALFAGACTSSVYVHGGRKSDSYDYSDSLYQLDTTMLQWSECASLVRDPLVILL